jgi:PspA/IM30 family/Helix-turn-helix domain
MGYQLRMHDQVRDWLTGLRDTEPDLARLVGEAVLAMIDAGGALGPPLVVPLESVLRRPADPREALDFSYQRQLEMLTKVRRGVADVATSRKRVELQIGMLEQQAAKLAGQREEALKAGRADLADEAGARAAGIAGQLAAMRRQYATLTGEEKKLTAASQRLQAKVEAFRIRKRTLKAGYTAAEASRTVRDAMADLGAETGDREGTPEEGTWSVAAGTAAAARDELLREVRDPQPDAQDAGPEDPDVVPPPGTMVLLPGAPDDTRAGLLFVVEPRDTAVLLACVADPGRAPGGYRDAARIAADRLPGGPASADPAGAPPAEVAPDGGFTSYDADSFLDEFFPGAETEVEIAAAALAARSRAHTLAEARQRMMLTQAQVAARMNVRQERVSAIERAEPGATEVRTLAAYVAALGGSLEIVAHIGDERLRLR